MYACFSKKMWKLELSAKAKCLYSMFRQQSVSKSLCIALWMPSAAHIGEIMRVIINVPGWKCEECLPMLIYRYPHYLLFSNPGTMLVTPMQFYYGGESVC